MHVRGIGFGDIVLTRCPYIANEGFVLVVPLLFWVCTLQHFRNRRCGTMELTNVLTNLHMRVIIRSNCSSRFMQMQIDV
jgi:hypothetical protein